MKNFQRAIDKFDYYGGQLPPFVLWSLATILIIFLGCLDYATGTEFDFAVFYLLPVAAVAWWSGFRGAIIASVCSVTAMLSSDWFAGLGHSHILFHLWEGMALSASLVVFSILLALLKSYVRNLRLTARIDYLTGVANRLAFFETAQNEIWRARRNLNPLTFAYIDIDRFKKVNDEKGHIIGDFVLKKVAQTIQLNLRATDLVARLGGDEFGLILPHSNQNITKRVIQKLSDSLTGMARSYEWPIGFSIGAVTFLKPRESTDEILARADELMYQVKKSGQSGSRHEIVEGDPSSEAPYQVKNRPKSP